MYLYLKKKNPKTFLVPCYDMDLIWHTHQVSFVIDQVNSLSPTIICCQNMKKYILVIYLELWIGCFDKIFRTSNLKSFPPPCQEMHNVGRFEHIVFVFVFLYSYVILWIFFDFNATLMLLWQLGFYWSIFCRLFCSMTVKHTIISQNWNLWFFYISLLREPPVKGCMKVLWSRAFQSSSKLTLYRVSHIFHPSEKHPAKTYHRENIWLK